MEPAIATTDERYGLPKYAGLRMTKAAFLRWESDDNYVYEFNHGILEPTISMRQEELPLLKRLTRRFAQTDAYRQGDELIPETNVWFNDEQMRRPDVAFYTADQIALMAVNVAVVPGFVVEFVSPSDLEKKRLDKLEDYFNGGVQVVWWVYPLKQQVHVYTSPKTVTICTDTDLLSAAPVLPEFQMTVAELFGR